MPQQENTKIAIILVLLGFGTLFGGSFALLSYLNKVFLGGSLSAEQITYVNIGVKLVIIALQVWFIVQIRRTKTPEM